MNGGNIRQRRVDLVCWLLFVFIFVVIPIAAILSVSVGWWGSLLVMGLDVCFLPFLRELTPSLSPQAIPRLVPANRLPILPFPFPLPHPHPLVPLYLLGLCLWSRFFLLGRSPQFPVPSLQSQPLLLFLFLWLRDSARGQLEIQMQSWFSLC